LDLPKTEAIAFFEREAEPYKVYFATTKGDDTVSIYRQGDWTDFCRGPHVPATGRLAAFKLLSVAGAYWLGSEKNKMPPAHLRHRVLEPGGARRVPRDARGGEEARPPEAGPRARPLPVPPVRPGCRVLDRARDDRLQRPEPGDEGAQLEDYREIKTPLLYNKSLWELSGHWGKYRENMFLVLDNETGEHDFSLKPMNCPSHHVYFGSKTHSYRELPIGSRPTTCSIETRSRAPCRA
jgi:threonyl-tRNA synthetase